MPEFRFEHRDGLALSQSDNAEGHAVLRWHGGNGMTLSVDEMRWLQTAALPGAIAVLAPRVTPSVAVGEQTTLLTS